MQLNVATTLVKNILVNEDEAVWNIKTAKDYIKNPKEISADAAMELNELAVEYDLTDWQAALVRKAKV